MGHEAGDVALAVADSGDIVHGTVRIPIRVACSVRRGIAENHLAVLLELRERSFVAGVVAIVVRDWHFQDLALLRGVRKRCVRLLDANVNVAADISQAAVAHHCAGEKARFAENLEAIANSQDHAAALGESLDGLHHWRKTRDGAGAQVIAEGKTAGQDDGIAVRQIFRLVPDEFDGLPQGVPDGVKSVVIAIGPGKNNDSKFHAVAAPCSLAGTTILAQTRLNKFTCRVDAPGREREKFWIGFSQVSKPLLENAAYLSQNGSVPR